MENSKRESELTPTNFVEATNIICVNLIPEIFNQKYETVTLQHNIEY